MIEFKGTGDVLKYTFFLHRRGEIQYIEINTYFNEFYCKSSIRIIDNNKIEWEDESWLHLSKEAKHYIERILNLKVFL